MKNSTYCIKVVDRKSGNIDYPGERGSYSQCQKMVAKYAAVDKEIIIAPITEQDEWYEGWEGYYSNN